MEQAENQPDQHCQHCGTALTSETSGGLCPRCLLEMNFASRTMPGGEPSPQVPPPSPEEIAERFPQFEILECLGRGGMGIVYKARQKALDRLVAIKVLAGERRDDPQFEERFSREARTLAKLSHPNIVTVHDFGESDGMFYLVMEFIDGVNLRDVLRDGRMEPAQALAIVPSICEALQFAHDHAVVHRDIKPENILMDRDGRVKIADFGIATLVGADAERSGTPPYMAPEQEAAEESIDHRADIYALGVVFYEMLTGERPEQDPSRPSQRVEVDVRLDEIVLRALEKEPEQRYQTAGEFRTMVETVVTNSAAEGVRPARSSRRDTVARGVLIGVWGMLVLIGTLPLDVSLWQKVLLSLFISSGVAAIFVLGAWFAARKRIDDHGDEPPVGTTAPGKDSAPTTSRGDYSPWEPTSVFAGTAVFVSILAFAWEAAVPFRVPLLILSVLGLGICSLSVAGYWPFISPLFPDPNFSSRNTRRCRRLAPEGSPAAGGTGRLLWTALVVVAIMASAASTLVFWLQRPQRIDEPDISATSPDGMYSANGQTWHEMRISGGDRTFYRFRIQGKAGAVWEKWDVEVPYDHLATSYVLLARDDILFGKHGRIVWSEDGKRASFRVNGLEVSAFNTVDGSHSFQGGYLPQRVVEFTPMPEIGSSFLDLDAGQILNPAKESVQALEANLGNAQMSPECCEWMRSTGADLRMHVGVSGLRLLDAASIAVMEKSDPRVDGRAFDIVSAGQAVEAAEAIEQAFAGSPLREPPLFFLNRDSVYAVRSREGAVALVEILDESELGPTRMRYKLVDPKGSGTASVTRTTETAMPTEAEDEQAARERVARGFFEAMLRGDVEGTRARLAPLSPLPHVVDLEEWVAEAPSALRKEHGGEAWRLTTFVEWLSDGDWAVARTTSMPDDSKSGLYVVLQRTDQDWGVFCVESAESGVPLRHYLDEARPFGEAAVETVGTGASGATPEGTLQEYTEAALSGDVEKALSFLAPPLSENREDVGKGILLFQVRRREGGGRMELVEWHKEGGYAAARYRLPPEALRAPTPFKSYVILERVGATWKVVWSSVSPIENSLADDLSTFRRFRLVDRGDSKAVVRAFIGAVRKGDPDLAMMLSGFPMSGNPSEFAREFSRVDQEESGFDPAAPLDWYEEGDYAVTRAKLLADQPGLETCLVLKRTGRIWQVMWANGSGSDTSLADNLERFKKEVLVGRVMVEDLALRFLVAIREKDEKTLRELCVDRTEGWTEVLVGQFSMEVRERFRQLTGEELTLYPGTLQIDRTREDKDLAVVRCLARKELQEKLEGNILVLHFCRTGDGWKVWTVRKALASQSLEEHLAQAREWAEDWEDVPPTVIRIVNQAQLPDVDRRDVPTVLDLASGEMLAMPPVEDEGEILGYFNKLGKGDLAWDQALITLRGARLNEWDENGIWDLPKPVRKFQDCASYRFDLPKRLLVTTAEGTHYTIDVSAGVEGGVSVDYQRGNVPPEVGDDGGATEEGDPPSLPESSGHSSDPVSRVKALLVTPPGTMPEGSPITVEQAKKILEKVTWGEFIARFADDGHEHDVSWKEVPANGGNGLRVEVSFRIGGETMRLDFEVDPAFRQVTPSRLRSAGHPEQVMADASEFLPVMILRYAAESKHPDAAAVAEEALSRARQVMNRSIMRQYGVALVVCQTDTGSLPENLQVLVDRHYVPELMPMLNHKTGKMEPPFYHRGLDVRKVYDPSKIIVLAAPSADPSGKRIVGFLDSHVAEIDEADYQAQLKAQQKVPVE